METMMDEQDKVDESGVKFESIEQVDDNWYHLTFDARALDENADVYETAEIAIQLRGEDLSEKSLNEISEMGRARVKALLAKFVDLC
ncbi:hypothetical protein DXM27_03730 [Rhizobium rhizogenes]|uniref:Uncharacterized protein n=2 Tax=Rhizobium rhizogenes TaxID=359 RepID=A0AA88F5X0_RHIRH|nr:hypothetical protein DXM27_03730 [Rhizobium rhizogenes]